MTSTTAGMTKMNTVVKGKLVHYSIVHPGGSKNVIILHGWGHEGALWLPMAEQMDPTWKVFLPDLPGFGQSRPLDQSAGVPEYAHWVKDYCLDLGLKDIIIIGHSFGGQVAVYLAGKQLISIHSLILLAPALVRRQRKQLSFKDSLVRTGAKFKWLLPITIRARLVKKWDYASATEAQKGVFLNSINYDVTPFLSMIHSPTLLVWGEKDGEILGNEKKLVNQLPNGRLRVIYDAGHNFQSEKPDQLLHIINHFDSLC